MAEETVLRPSPIVTSEAPTQKISGGEIAQPYQMLARSMDKLGQGLEDMATPLAEQAGYKAVTRDADGNIQVDRMPIFGRAGDAYAHAVKMGALAQGEGDAKRADIGLREQYRDNPEGYQTAAKAFKDKTVQQYTAAAGPEVGTALGQAIDNTTTYTYRGLLNEKERLDLQRAEGQINAGLTDARDDAMVLARQGAGPDEPAMKTALDKYTTLLDSKAGNPRLAYSQEQRALDLQKFQGELGGQRHLYHIDQTYKDKGAEAALEDAKDILTNPDYKLTPAQRQAYYHQAVGEVRANEALRKQDVGLANESFRDIKSRLALGEQIEPAEVDAVRGAFAAANYPAGVAAVDGYFAHKDLHDSYGQQPIHQQLTELNTIRGAAASRDIYQGLRQRGYSEAAAAGIAGNLVWESGLRPAVPGDRGTSTGLAQWHAERLDALKSFAARQGKPWQDPNTQLDFLHQELQTTESITGGMLRTATTPEEAAQIFATGFERPATATAGYAARQRLARSIFEGKAVDGSAGPGASSWLIANRAATLKTSATETWKQVMKDWDNGKGPSPARDTVGDVIEAARSTNNIDLMAKVQNDAEMMDYAERIKTEPLDRQEALETELRRRIAAGETRQADVPAAMQAPGADLVLKQLQERTQAIRKGLEDNPVATAIANNPQRFKTPEPLDAGNPQQFTQGLAMRTQISRAAANQWGTAPLSALDAGDVMRVKAALATPDLAKRAQVWGMLATLPDDVRGPTFEKIAKNDPNALAEASAGSMMATDPDMAKSIMAGLDIMSRDDKGILKVFEPKAGGAEGFDASLPTMLPPTAYGAENRLNPSGAYSINARMIQARYAYLAAQDPKGGTTFSETRLQQAVNDVTGGTVSQGGAKTVAPRPGMSQSQFDGVMGGLTDRDLAGITSLNGQPISADFLRGQARLEAIGAGRYLVNFSKGDPPIYAYRYAGTEMPERFVLDLSRRAPAYPQPGFPGI